MSIRRSLVPGSLIFLLFIWGIGHGLVAGEVEVHPSHPIRGLNLDWPDVTYITWVDAVTRHQWVATLGLQIFDNHRHRRPSYADEFPDEDTSESPYGTYLLVARIDDSGRIVMRAQRLIPGAIFIGVHYARVRTLDPWADDDECAFIVTSDFQRFYCYNQYLDRLGRFRLQQRVLAFDVYPTEEGKKALLIFQKRADGWLHLLDPKTGQVLRSWMTTREVREAIKKQIRKSEKTAVLDFFKDPSHDVMESPNVVLVVQPPLIIGVVARKANFFFMVDNRNIKQIRSFPLKLKVPPTKIIAGPGFSLENAFPATNEKPFAKRIWLYGSVNILTEVSEIARIHPGYFIRAKERYGDVRHRTIASLPSLIELDVRRGRAKWIQSGIMDMDGNRFYQPDIVTVKKQNVLYGVMNVYQLDPLKFRSYLGSLLLTGHTDE